jgi:curli biogenesis system outer membrane secretion channel CsgG
MSVNKAKNTQSAALITITGALLLLQACVAPDTSGRIAEQATPKASPVRARSYFGENLRCLDHMLARADVQAENGMGIRSRLLVGVPADSVGNNAGLREMILTALHQATRTSRYIAVSDYMDKDLFQSTFYGGRVSGSPAPPDSSAPLSLQGNDLYITGAVTQSDKNVSATTAGGGFGFGGSAVGAGYERGEGTVAIDLRLSHLSTYLINSVANMAVIQEKDRSTEAEITFGKFGAGAEFGWATKEGQHQAVRMLVELSVAELLGDYAQVPYWECLSVKENNPAVRGQMIDWYEHHARKGTLRAFFRKRLQHAGDYDAAENDRGAVAHFQHRKNLTPTGELSFETFVALIRETGEDAPRTTVAARAEPAQEDAPGSAAIATPEEEKKQRPALTALTLHKTALTGGAVRISVRPDGASYLACFYQDRLGRLSRIYPNPHRSEAHIEAENVTIPDVGSGFSIIPGKEESEGSALVICGASSKANPAAIAELTPEEGKFGLRIPESREDILRLLQQADPDMRIQAMLL